MTSALTIPDISAETGMPLPPPIEELDVYHENGKGFLVGRNGDYIAMNNSEMRRHLLSLGYSREKRSPLSEVDQALHDIQFTKSVVYAGPLAGYSPGLREVCGNRILVTGAPKIIEPDPKVEWPVIRKLIEQMLCADQGRQFPPFYGWLSVAYRSLRRREISQGQALALAGPRACGKTLLQQIIREILGGREGNPYPYMIQKTPFNRELFGAENLMFGDEVASTSYTTRTQFGAMLKQLVVNPTQRCHGSFRMYRPDHAAVSASQPLVSPEEVMSLLGYSDRDAFMRMARRSGLPRIRINARVIRFERPALAAWLARRRIGF